MTMTLTFDAVSESTPGEKWRARWMRSWPAYEAWFLARGGDAGPDRKTCEAALARYMPELLPVHRRLVALAGGGDRAARFLTTWCPPRYLNGCSLAAMSDGTDVRLLRNYDLSPDLNEGLLLRSEWTGRPVMGMIEFLWGVSDGINEAGLSVALAYGGRSETGEGFGVTTILRYVLEVCDTVEEALGVLDRVPSHMAYNIVLADASGAIASVELSPGGGARRMPRAIATNHQSGGTLPDRAPFTRTYERHRHLSALRTGVRDLHADFTRAPLRQDRYSEGFGTLFTAEYDPLERSLRLIWPDEDWHQTLARFEEGRRDIVYAPADARNDAQGWSSGSDWSRAAEVDWAQVGRDYAAGVGRPIEAYLPQPGHA
ncbi:C45 family autoproteolytic acyltransferase/hydolase [Oceaniglobus roseus]|uniref:C45 family autoproteolytic acyltransferase/hydolase n=1 Tax=Oceaniglobus roseus TaxID=1737570 RepID=UPI000C7EF1D4|nr:C45 family peptidase [Kandeliimicrobium roseum]